jgi:hypothetical protein
MATDDVGLDVLVQQQGAAITALQAKLTSVEAQLNTRLAHVDARLNTRGENTVLKYFWLWFLFVL